MCKIVGAKYRMKIWLLISLFILAFRLTQSIQTQQGIESGSVFQPHRSKVEFGLVVQGIPYDHSWPERWLFPCEVLRESMK